MEFPQKNNNSPAVTFHNSFNMEENPFQIVLPGNSAKNNLRGKLGKVFQGKTFGGI